MALTDEQKESVSRLGEVLADGRPLSEFFDVGEDYMRTVEATAFQMYSNEKYEEAKVLATGLVALNAERYYPHLLLGDLYLHDGDLESAIEHLETANALKEEDPCVRFKLAQAALQAEDEERGYDLLEEVIMLDEGENRFAKQALLILSALAPDRIRQAKEAADETLV